MMYRRALPLLIALALGLAACGSDGADTDAGSGVTDTTGGPDTTADPDTPTDSDSTDTTTGSDSGDDQTQPSGDGSAPVLGGGGAIGSLEITITHPDADDVTYAIGCFGDTFPVTPEVDGVDGALACERLADEAVRDRLLNGRPADQVCTEIYGGPDVAVITGEIDGEAVDATIDRVDGCAISDWDDLLAGVLPPALGVTS